MSEDEYSRRGGKPCKACTDYKSWMNIGPHRSAESIQTVVDKIEERDKKSEASIKTETASTSPPPKNETAGAVLVEPDQSVLDAQRGICPPDRTELGSATWTFLHSVAAYFPAAPDPAQQEDARQLLNIVSRLYPCSDCAEDLRADLKEEPPVVTSTAEFSQWLCRLHNRVNVKLNKPIFDCSKVLERWKDGWKDGSCD